jgi:hypothetical protein
MSLFSSLPRISRRHLLITTTCLGLSTSPLAVLAQAQDVGGIKFDPQVTVQGHPLQLNGAGVRYKAVFKVYAAGLYLSQKADTPEAVLATTGPKRMRLTMLRDINNNEFGKLFTRGVEDNTPRGDMSRLVPGLIRMGEIFSANKRFGSGDTILIDWYPGEGTYITVNGKVQGEAFKEPEFFNALMRIWLGKAPADHVLKDALMGKLT